MLCVVMGHVLLFGIGVGKGSSLPLRLIDNVQMPTFFFISGLMGYKHTHRWHGGALRRNMWRKCRVLLVPALAFYALYQATHGGPLTAFLTGGFGLYWFTFTLLEFFLVYYALVWLEKWTHRSQVVNWGLVLVSLAGIAHVDWLVPLPQWFAPLQVGEFFCYFQFFAAGVLARKYHDGFMRLATNGWLIGACIVTFVLCSIPYGDAEFQANHPLPYMLLYGEVLRWTALAVVFAFFHRIRGFFESHSPLVRSWLFIGRRTLDIYMLHYFFIPTLTGLAAFVSLPGQSGLTLLLVAAIGLAIIALTMLCSALIRTSPALAHWLLGTK